ncbi:MAG TPA: Hpt domain-containing protein [Candidatus Competibacter sp.]|nr:histidine kinase [Candidatus Competibacteraceae bacterium]HRC72354.1 Hpt domain-containing protein [Candidatus Competibacter sp.]
MSDLDLNEWPLLDDEVILELREVMEDEFADLLQNFLDDLPLQLERLQDAIARGDAGQLYQTGHKFKSSCGSLGALRLAEWVQRLEQAGRSNALEEARRWLQAARAVAAETAAALQAQLK